MTDDPPAVEQLGLDLMGDREHIQRGSEGCRLSKLVHALHLPPIGQRFGVPVSSVRTIINV